MDLTWDFLLHHSLWKTHGRDRERDRERQRQRESERETETERQRERERMPTETVLQYPTLMR